MGIKLILAVGKDILLSLSSPVNKPIIFNLHNNTEGINGKKI